MELGIVSVEGSYLKSSCASPFYLCVSMATLEQSSLSSQLAWTTKYVVSHQSVTFLRALYDSFSSHCNTEIR